MSNIEPFLEKANKRIDSRVVGLISVHAETVVLANLIAKNDYLYKIQYLSVEDFAFNEHQIVFRFLQDTIPIKEVGIANIASLFNEDYDLKDVGGKAKWMGLLISSSGEIMTPCARLVKDLSDKRKLNDILKEKIQEIQSGRDDISVPDVLEDINQQSLALSHSHSSFKIKKFVDVTQEMIEDLDKVDEIYPTGLDKIDKTMDGGLKAGCSYCIAAKPKAGKTMIKSTIAGNLRKRDDKFLFIACEMGSKSINKRIIGAEIGRSPKAFKSEKNNPQFASKLVSTITDDKQSMYYVDAPRVSLKNLELIVNKAVYQYGIKGFILDYLQLVTGSEKGVMIAQHQENVAQTIAELSKKHNIWSLYSAQINRSGEVRNGDGIIMAVDWIYELHQIEKKYETDPSEIWLEHIATRETEPMNIGSEENPAFRIAKTGTHMEEIDESETVWR